MTIKAWGALMILVACGSVGMGMAASYIKEERAIRQLIAVLEYMIWELQCSLMPLPELCRQAAAQSSGMIRDFFDELAAELNSQICPNVSYCMIAAMAKIPVMPRKVQEAVNTMIHTFGKFQMDGQVEALRSTIAHCEKILAVMEHGKENRLRSYKTLGVCAGGALVILFI